MTTKPPKTAEEFAALPILPQLGRPSLSGAGIDGDSICVMVIGDDVWEPTFYDGKWYRKELNRLW